MKILILGAGGMIGHKVYQRISEVFPDTYATFRRPLSDYETFKIFDPAKSISSVDVTDFEGVKRILDKVQPEVVINCVGVTLRKKEITDLAYALEVNSLLPHKLKCWSAQSLSKVIHFSTDCVFDGSGGPYFEDACPSAKDIYGKTKYLGEVQSPTCLTLRGSMIGRELYGKSELLEWTLSQKGQTIKGYSGAIYSGVTTSVMAQLVISILQRPLFMSGLYHVSSQPISKFELLVKINDAFGLGLKILEDCSYVSKKELDSSKIYREIGFVCPSWSEMIDQLVLDT